MSFRCPALQKSAAKRSKFGPNQDPAGATWRRAATTISPAVRLVASMLLLVCDPLFAFLCIYCLSSHQLSTSLSGESVLGVGPCASPLQHTTARTARSAFLRPRQRQLECRFNVLKLLGPTMPTLDFSVVKSHPTQSGCPHVPHLLGYEGSRSCVQLWSPLWKAGRSHSLLSFRLPPLKTFCSLLQFALSCALTRFTSNGFM